MDLGTLERIAQHRVCQECGMEFHTNPQAMAMEQFADHLAVHQPTVKQWSEAYLKIQRSKVRSTGRTASE